MPPPTWTSRLLPLPRPAPARPQRRGHQRDSMRRVTRPPTPTSKPSSAVLRRKLERLSWPREIRPALPSGHGHQQRPHPQATRRAVCLFLGLDSAVTLACARRDASSLALSFDYGQGRHTATNGRRHPRGHMPGGGPPPPHPQDRPRGHRPGSALTADIAVPKNRSEADLHAACPHLRPPPATSSPFLRRRRRPEVPRPRDLYIGGQRRGHSGYQTAAPSSSAFEHAANLGTSLGAEKPGLRRPLARIRHTLGRPDKAQTQLGAELGVDFSLTHSCYDPVVPWRRSGVRPLRFLPDPCRGFFEEAAHRSHPVRSS